MYVQTNRNCLLDFMARLWPKACVVVLDSGKMNRSGMRRMQMGPAIMSTLLMYSVWAQQGQPILLQTRLGCVAHSIYMLPPFLNLISVIFFESV